MIDTQKKGRPTRIKGWMMTLAGLLLMQLFFIVCDMYFWSPYREFKPGTLIGKIINSKLFTEWFTPYTCLDIPTPPLHFC